MRIWTESLRIPCTQSQKSTLCSHGKSRTRLFQRDCLHGHSMILVRYSLSFSSKSSSSSEKVTTRASHSGHSFLGIFVNSTKSHFVQEFSRQAIRPPRSEFSWNIVWLFRFHRPGLHPCRARTPNAREDQMPIFERDRTHQEAGFWTSQA
jgi:hypothetical protein